LSITIANVPPDGLVSTAFSGITSAFGTVFAIISTRMLEPGRSLPSALSACTHTSTVVFEASSAGLITVTVAAIGAPPGPMMFAASPSFSSDASAGGMCTRAITCETSITVTIGAPLGAISPG
jgi:hypothetical protein